MRYQVQEIIHPVQSQQKDLDFRNPLNNYNLFSMGAKTKVPNPQKVVPGPGQYNESILSETGLKYKFGSDSRMKYNEKKDRSQPGPGQYENSYERLAHLDGRTVFGKEK